MAVSWSLPKIVSKILEDIPAINVLLNALAKMDYTGTEDFPKGAVRLASVSGGYQLQTYNGTSWVSVGKLIHDADSVDGKSANTGTAAGTVPVRDSSGKLPGDITGNAASADTADTLSKTLLISLGGTGATTASGARSNLGVPPTSHASTATTYGISSATRYGHAMAASDAPAQDTDSGSVGSDVSHFARGDHAHKKVLGTSSVYGQVKLTDSVASTSAASSHVGASAKAVKTAYDKAVEAATTEMTGATSSAAGRAGLVPAPAKGAQNRPLRGDGTWATSLTCNITGNCSGSSGSCTGNAATATRLLDGTGNMAMPIGSVYVQFYGQAAPADIFGGTWSNVSSSYAGRFFRAEGGSAAAFGGVQSGGMPNAAGQFLPGGGSYVGPGNFSWANGIVSRVSYRNDYTYRASSDGGYATYYFDINLSRSNGLFGAADEVRPINSTIRIWKRTA